jgi:DNA-binding response OmpR family regulator
MTAARPRVLFVEDEASISGPFTSALAREGFDSVVVRTLAAARDEAARIDRTSCCWT